jgi:hypothetical protein
MFVNVDKLTDFLVEHEINIEQYYFLFLHYLDDVRTGKLPIRSTISSSKYPLANLYKYSNKVDSFVKEDIDNLIEKGFINKFGESSSYAPDDFVVTSKFIDLMMSTEEDFEIFWEEYPAFTDNFDDPHRGNRIPLKSVIKEEVEELFNKRCQTKNKFDKIMHGLRVAKEKKEINMNIMKWLGGEYWTAYQDETLEEYDNDGRTVV